MYKQDKAGVLTSEGPTELFECNIGVKQGCPATPLLFSLYLDELETLLEDASEHIDCPRLAQLLIAILMFADDIILFSNSPRGLQHQLNILQEFCTARGLKVNVLKTKTMVFESRRTHTPPFTYAGAVIDQFELFKYLTTMHATRGLTAALETFCKAAKRAMFGLHSRCQQLYIHYLIVKCKFFDALVKPILCYGCAVWSIGGNKSTLAELERTEIGFLKWLLGVQTHTSTLHVLAEIGRYPLQLSWQAFAEKHFNCLEKLENSRMLKQAFIADCSLPARLSCTSLLAQHGQLHGHPVSPSTDAATQRPMLSLSVARSHHVEQLSQQTSSKSSMYKSIKIGYACEPYIKQTSNRHL